MPHGSSCRDSTIQERTSFFTIWCCCGVLILLALWNIRRGKKVYPEFHASMQQFDQLRWLTLLNTVLQAQLFVGYYLNNSTLVETAWVIWVTTAGLCLATLGVRTSQACYDLCSIEDVSDLSARKDDTDGIIRIIYVFWSSSTVVNVVGTVVPWRVSKYDPEIGVKLQFACFAVWQLLAAICLSCTVYRLIRVYKLTVEFLHSLESYSDHHPSSVKLKTVISSVKKMKRLTMCIFVLIAILLAACAIDFYYFAQMFGAGLDHAKKQNYFSDYGTQKIPSWQLFYIYFPLWSFVQIISLVYCWVPEHFLWSAVEELTWTSLNANSSKYTGH